MKRTLLLGSLSALLCFSFFTACQKEEEEPAPIASFAASKTSAEVGEDIVFTNQSTHATTFVWDFDDGTTSTLENPTHAFSESGTYTVELTAKGAGGTHSATETISVEDPEPVADFSMSKTTALVGEEISFTNNSLNATSYEWSFGDGSASTEAHPKHTYLMSGNYMVMLRATGPGGEHTTSKNITINDPPPVAGFTKSHTTAEVGTEISFTNTSVHATSYSWDFGDGGTSTATNPKHTYATAGEFEITLEVTGPGGVDAFSDNITITEPEQPEENLIMPGEYAGRFILGDNLGVHKSKITTGETPQHAAILRNDGSWLHVLLYTQTGIGFGLVTSSSTLYNTNVPFVIISTEAFNGITDKGIKVGNTFSQVTAAYGAPEEISSSGTHYYYAKGVYFGASSTDNTHVDNIAVFEPILKKSTKSPVISELEDLMLRGNFNTLSPGALR